MQQWNTEPGALIARHNSGIEVPRSFSRIPKSAKFTGVIHVTQMIGDHLIELVDQLFAAEKCNQVVLLWASDFDIPDVNSVFTNIPEGKTLNLIEDKQQLLTNKFKNRSKVYLNE